MDGRCKEFFGSSTHNKLKVNGYKLTPLLLVVGFCLASLNSFSQGDSSYHACYYPEQSFTLGSSYTYGTNFKGSGINFRGYYNFTEQFCAGPEFSVLKTKETTLNDINLVAHYILETKLLAFYPVSGINYSIEKFEEFDADLNELTEHIDQGFAFVLGAGVHRNFRRITIFTEFSHHFGVINDNILNAGILIMFNHKKHING